MYYYRCYVSFPKADPEASIPLQAFIDLLREEINKGGAGQGRKIAGQGHNYRKILASS